MTRIDDSIDMLDDLSETPACAYPRRAQPARLS